MNSYSASLAAAGLIQTLLMLPLAALPWESGAADPTAEVSNVPFGPGERLEYRASVGLFGDVGAGSMEVLGVERLRGRRAYHLRFEIKGGVLFARVDNRMESWMDVERLFSHRFEQDQNEPRTERHRIFDFFPEEQRWARLDSDESGPLPTARPQDQVSFLYWARTLPLEVGETYVYHDYFQERGNPIVLRVLRRETITVPAGTFRTIVVQPIIQTRGLFGEGGRAEVYFTDDDRRLPVQLKSRIPVLRSLNLYLHSYTVGTPLEAGG